MADGTIPAAFKVTERHGHVERRIIINYEREAQSQPARS
jgi:hypothetical protein